ncbi:bifunctional phosphopantothenoylcysteine decarboxylase/phosphopantothenate--cysteine ligase CoaBC [bacterium]|nr:bifunctional phosphopantothenoylcysteine decarboxylase/phosphopantothenate--cysteine ligase CoaBC [bacterium]
MNRAATMMNAHETDILHDRRIALGVTGGIAAFKVAGLVTALRKRGAQVRVIMTEAATWFVTPTSFATLSGNEVGLEMFGGTLRDELQHVHMQDFAEVLLIAPATADIIGKIAHGLADDLLSTTVMALTCPVVLAPAMNVHMWQNPIVQRNVAMLRELGYGFVMPEAGRLASGAEGEGRLAGTDFLLAAVERALQGALPRYDLQGKTIVVSAGPTREPLDPVRFVSNRSTGRMGYALAAEAERRGAEVILISGPTELPAPPGVDVRPVTTNAEMKQAVLAAMPNASAFVSAAAPADYRPAQVHDRKIKKGEKLVLDLEQTDDILLAVGEQARPSVLVGFAAETGDAVAQARPKLARKNLDVLVVNDVAEAGSGFGVDTNRVTILRRDGSESALPLMSKHAVAAAILDEIAPLIS